MRSLRKKREANIISTVDTVIFAVGQRPDITEEAGLELGRGNSIVVKDMEKDKTTSVEGIFAAGDDDGTKSVIMAIESGREAASQIDKYLGGDGDISEKLAPEQNADPYIGQCPGFGYGERKEPQIDEAEKRQDNFNFIRPWNLRFRHLRGSRTLSAVRSSSADLRTETLGRFYRE